MSYGQKEHLEPCGTISQRSDWLKKYQKNPTAYPTRSDEILWVPMSVTLVADGNGNGLYSERALHEAICRLNSDFSETNIQFYLGAPIRYLKNTAYAQHTDILVGAQMMFENNLPDMINNYVMVSAAGNCGYNLPYAGIALSTNCMGADDHTWAHEIGHNLSLPHPFLGWEGGPGINGVSHNYNEPAPEKVTYDYTYFQDTLILDTLIVDTTYVEKIDGSNCTFAADGFCDTKPDYIASRWNCDENSNGFTEQTDPNGEKFYSDGSLFMSYALDNCSNRFTEDQIAAMRANLIDEKPSYLGNENVIDPIPDGEVAVVTPEELEVVYFEDVYIEWEPVENATAYTIQVTKTPTWGLTVFDSIVTQPNVVIDEMRFKNSKYYFRIKALNEYHFCTDFHVYGSFESTDTQTSVEDNALATIKVQPSVLSSGQSLNIINPENHQVDLFVTDIVGNKFYQDDQFFGSQRVTTQSWPAGVYLVNMQMGTAVATQKIVITK